MIAPNRIEKYLDVDFDVENLYCRYVRAVRIAAEEFADMIQSGPRPNPSQLAQAWMRRDDFDAHLAELRFQPDQFQRFIDAIDDCQ